MLLLFFIQYVYTLRYIVLLLCNRINLLTTSGRIQLQLPDEPGVVDS